MLSFFSSEAFGFLISKALLFSELPGLLFLDCVVKDFLVHTLQFLNVGLVDDLCNTFFLLRLVNIDLNCRQDSVVISVLVTTLGPQVFDYKWL